MTIRCRITKLESNGPVRQRVIVLFENDEKGHDGLLDEYCEEHGNAQEEIHKIILVSYVESGQTPGRPSLLLRRR